MTNAMSGDVKEEYAGSLGEAHRSSSCGLKLWWRPLPSKSNRYYPCQTPSLEVNMVLTPIDIAASLKWFTICITASLRPVRALLSQWYRRQSLILLTVLQSRKWSQTQSHPVHKLSQWWYIWHSSIGFSLVKIFGWGAFYWRGGDN